MKKYFSNILKDNTQSKLFIQQGYIKIPFLNDEEVETLKNLLEYIKMPEIELFHSQINEGNDLNRKYNKIISEFIQPYLTRLNLSDNYKIIISVYINKLPSKNTTFDIHTDDSLCDERYFTAINIWIPLTYVDSNNGTICISNGSHHNTLTLRSYTIKDKFLEKNKEALKQSCMPIEVQKGNALIYSPACVHLSRPNYSQENRPVIALALIPQQADLCCFDQKRYIFRKNKIVKYKLKIDELLNKSDFSMLDYIETINL